MHTYTSAKPASFPFRMRCFEQCLASYVEIERLQHKWESNPRSRIHWQVIAGEVSAFVGSLLRSVAWSPGDSRRSDDNVLGMTIWMLQRRNSLGGDIQKQGKWEKGRSTASATFLAFRVRSGDAERISWRGSKTGQPSLQGILVTRSIRRIRHSGALEKPKDRFIQMNKSILRLLKGPGRTRNRIRSPRFVASGR